MFSEAADILNAGSITADGGITELTTGEYNSIIVNANLSAGNSNISLTATGMGNINGTRTISANGLTLQVNNGNIGNAGAVLLTDVNTVSASASGSIHLTNDKTISLTE